jgi:hypothetical protein
MSSKTIEINPSLFTVGGLSKKNRSKKNKSMSVPLISPNILKNKLLKRIKDHKNKETAGLDTSKKKMSSEVKKDEPVLNNNINTYSDEFNESIEYLQTLSKQKKIDTENNIKKAAIQRKTIKNYSSTMPVVNLELPDELKESFITVDTETIKPSIMPTNITPANIVPSSVTPVLIRNKPNDVPYGILKGGNKPTYRQWNKTQKNYQPNGNNLTINAPKSEREQRLNQLKQKLKQQSTVINQPQPQAQPIQIVTQPQLQPIQTAITEPNLEEILLTQNLIQKPNSEFTTKTPIINNLSQGGGVEKIKTVKKLLKKTIHKKYTLGKSKIKKTVGVLLKDKNTRKNIISAQKDLRDKPVTDVKTYLRQHNLIKIGSNAPNDVIRKIYESAMLAGEITNNNKDIMIHNFIKDDT